MTPFLVDALELIQVQEKQRERNRIPRRSTKLLFAEIHEVAHVVGTRDVVDEGVIVDDADVAAAVDDALERAVVALAILALAFRVLVYGHIPRPPGAACSRDTRSFSVRALAATVQPSCAKRRAKARPIPAQDN